MPMKYSKKKWDQGGRFSRVNLLIVGLRMLHYTQLDGVMKNKE